MRNRRIYVASSWRNQWQPGVVTALRDAGHEVYDFRNPAPGNTGFAWSEIDREWLKWTPEEFAEKLRTHPIAAAGFKLDRDALDWCDTCVLVLPCGRSAHLELGYAAGQGKDTYVLLHEDKFEPELMYLLNDACASDIKEIIAMMAQRQPIDIHRWHVEAGAHFSRPSSHAVRLLREVIELCYASGAYTWEVLEAVANETEKASKRGGIGQLHAPAVEEEWADCAILLEAFRALAMIDGKRHVREKANALWGRKWRADIGGALYRP